DVWPQETNQNTKPMFRRVPLSVSNLGGALFVSRADALPEDWVVDQPVWTAGTRSWQKLAARGIWVNGCSDGLGESVPELDTLLGENLAWTKLTHEDSTNDALFPCFATYRLEPLETSPPPLVKAYFWPSESLFRWALQLRPEIRQAQHAAG